MLNTFKYNRSLKLESGDMLPSFELAYQTFGKLNADKTNVVWITHALTANANAAEWWGGLVGEGKLLDPTRYFIICANVLGSPYGSTNPLSIKPFTGLPYYHSFPSITIRDIVATLDLLRQYLGLSKIHLLIGGSLGGQQALEWAIQQNTVFDKLILLATNAQHSAWGIAFNESQRLAIQADATWQTNSPDAGSAGLKAARSIALLSYRNYYTYVNTQTEIDDEFKEVWRASSYQRYQGDKLASRFNAFSYWYLSKAMDSHNIGRGRDGLINALAQIKAQTLVIGITSDLLFPVNEQITLACGIEGAIYQEIDSLYGHDGFLIEAEAIANVINAFFADSEQTTTQDPENQVKI